MRNLQLLLFYLKGIALCNCLKGYGGAKCNECAPGYNGFPNCKPCACDERGIKTTPLSCESRCDCKVLLLLNPS